MRKINLEDWTFIGKYNFAAKWLQPFCSYYLVREDDKTIKRIQKVSLYAYILMFIPLHLLQAIVLMWDGGLKEFEIFKRDLGFDILNYGTLSYTKANTILESHY